MSRYLVLLILCLPFIILAITSCVVRYKMNKISLRRTISTVLFWVSILGGLIFAEPLYNWLFTHELTASEPLSLFDVVTIFGVVTLLYVVYRLNSRLESIEERTRILQEEFSIYTSGD